MKNRLLFLLLIVLCLLFTHAGTSDAKEQDSYIYFDKHLQYDIYFESGERGSSVINNAKIIGFKEIAGKTFLVIETNSFKLEEGPGYVLFDSIHAILPDKHFKVHSSSKINFRH